MSLEERFGTAKPVIAMVHFPGLPGRPRHDRDAGRNRLLDVVGRDLAVLQEAGVDAVLFCNEADIPYQLAVGPEIPAAGQPASVRRAARSVARTISSSTTRIDRSFSGCSMPRSSWAGRLAHDA